jgi:scyllo-inositol 2-dehydrogenase (NADP+)
VAQSGVLGKIHRFEARFDRYKPLPNVKKWKEEAGAASGILYDLGSHIIDQAIALFGAPKSVGGEVYRQREGSNIDDAFDLRLQYGALQVQLSSSLLVREPTPRYMLHGDKGAFVKYGLDPQEDQLKAGLWPGMPGFGVESAEFQGLLNTTYNNLPFRGKVETLPGNWMLLFQNIADVLHHNAAPLIRLEQVLTQVEIMAQVTS